MPLSLDKLPPLDLVRSFVAVGRRLSITVAAGELHVTQSAVSRQIAALEDIVGVKLFVRHHRSIAFTPEGERLFERCHAATMQLQEVFEKITVPRHRRPVVITSPTGFANLWLVPRIAQLQSRHPDIELHIATSNTVYDLKSEGVDLAVRYGDRPAGRGRPILLLPEAIAPVARPGLLAGPLTHPEQLSNVTLLEFDYTHRREHLGWQCWLAKRGWSHWQPRGVNRFNHYDQAVNAAIAGQGIVLGRLELLGLALETGTLELVGEPESSTQASTCHWLLRTDPHPRHDVRMIIDWLIREAAESAARTGLQSLNT